MLQNHFLAIRSSGESYDFSTLAGNALGWQAGSGGNQWQIGGVVGVAGT